MAEKKTVRKKKKKQKRKLTPIMRLLCLVFIGISAWLLYGVAKEVYTTVTLKSELAAVEDKLQEVQDENKRLTDQKEKLQDPDYMESYARGNYMLSKSGEQIFYLPENTSK